jgi:succinoglycan biosynthesis protein ExoM
MRLLHETAKQVTEGIFTYSIVVVDNDQHGSAKGVVDRFQEEKIIPIEYHVEPEQNIALARNRCVDAAKGDLIAFIDDDEFPDAKWLLTLYRAYLEFHVQGILGPVEPYFAGTPPAWLVKGGFCVRQHHRTGTVLDPEETRTGNALLDASLFADKKIRFSAEFGRTGGEDIELFKLLARGGNVFVWCNEACVYEEVPPERWGKSFYLKRYLRIGGLSGEKVGRESSRFHPYLFKASVGFIGYVLSLPVAFLFGGQYSMKSMTKALYFLGWILGFYGHVVVRYRDD